MTRQFPDATVIGGGMQSAENDDAEAAFARMMAANPAATVIGSGPATTEANDVDSAIARALAENPDAVIIRGPAGGGVFGNASPMMGGNWVFSSDLSDEGLSDVQGLIGMQGLNATGSRAPAETDSDGAEAAFAQFPDAKPAFARMMATIPAAAMVDRGSAEVDANGAEAAFARMAARFPNATVIGGARPRNRARPQFAVYVRACVRARVRACVRACVRPQRHDVAPQGKACTRTQVILRLAARPRLMTWRQPSQG